MLSTTHGRLTRNGKSIILAHDHGLEHGPTKFEGVRERLDPETVFEMATHDAVTGFAVGKGLAETYYPSYEDDVNLLAKLNGGSSLWMGEPDSAVNWSVEYAAELGADAAGDCRVVLSGGAKTGDYEFLSTVETAMDAGAAGLAVGRNVWQHDDPTYILDALEQVVFEEATATEALDT